MEDPMYDESDHTKSNIRGVTKVGPMSIVGRAAGDFELFGPEGGSPSAEISGSLQSEDLPELIPDSPQSPSPPAPRQSLSSHLSQHSSTPPSSYPERPKMYSRSSSSQLSRSDRSASVPVPSLPKPPRRRTQEFRDQSSFFPTLYGAGRSTSSTSTDDSTSSSTGHTPSIGVGVGPGAQFWNPHTDHPLSLAEQEDLLDRVRRDLLGVNLEGLKGPLKALALSSQQQAPEYGAEDYDFMKAGSDIYPRVVMNESGSDGRFKKTTVSPQEAFLDYDAIDHRLHSDPSRPYSSSSLGLGVGACGSLFAPLPLPSSIDQKQTLLKNGLKQSSNKDNVPSPSNEKVNSATSNSNLSGRLSVNSSASTLSASTDTSKQHQHHHHHHNHNGNKKQSTYSFNTPRNAVSWLGRQKPGTVESNFLKNEAESSSASSQPDLSSSYDEKSAPKAKVAHYAGGSGGAKLEYKTSTSDADGDGDFGEDSESTKEEDVKGTPKLPSRLEDDADVTSDREEQKQIADTVSPVLKVKLADLHRRQRDRTATPSLSERSRNSATPTSFNVDTGGEEKSKSRPQTSAPTPRPHRLNGENPRAGSASPDVASTPTSFAVSHQTGSASRKPKNEAQKAADEHLSLAGPGDRHGSSDEYVPVSISSHPPSRRTAAIPVRPFLKRNRSPDIESDQSGSNEDEELEDQDEESEDDRPIRGANRRKRTFLQPNKRRRRAPPTSTTTTTSSTAIRCTHVDASTGKVCGVVFRRPYDLARHKETIHGEGLKGGRKEWVCGSCGGSFSRKDALIRHARIRGHRA